MSANPIADFDVGPLTWVKTEIDHSLKQARESLDKLLAKSADRSPVKYILTHLHQATGALAMVGLGAATRFNEELEKLVAFLEGEDAARLAPAIAAAKRGIAALSAYLDALLAGQPDRPMGLLPAYLEINHARGQNDAAEGDLFYPNLAAPLPDIPGAAAVDAPVRAKALALQRVQYQQGLLRMLKGADTAEAMRQMHGAITAIESVEAASASRAFWTAAAGLFDALVFRGMEVTPAVKPLFAKLDQQVKQLIDGSVKVPERLFRDLLLAVGRAGPVTERITLLKRVYRLDDLLAPPDAGLGEAHDETVIALVRELRDLTAQLKDAWLKYTSGNRAALEPFGQQAAAIAQRSARLPNRELQLVLARLDEVAPTLRAKAIPPSEAQSLEVATAMLFLESTLENYRRLGADFAQQARTVAERLAGAMAGEALPPLGAEGGLLDEMTRRAQEKLLIFQVGQEVQVNLQNIEQVLDAFFRDSSKRADLKPLLAQFSQVQGALMILELMDAAALSSAVMGRVQQFLDGAEGTGEAADMVADGLSALGLYVTALQEGAASPRDVLVPALVRFGLAEREKPGEAEVRRTGTVSPVDLDVQKQKVQALYEDYKEKPAAATREKLEKAVGDLQRDAAVVSDSAVARQSEQALQAIKESERPDQTGLFNAIQSLAPEKAPETPAPQVVQLVDAPGAEIDRELLEIFLEEAGEVIGAIASHVEVCRGSPHDRDALTTIRRGFHTLKGSGRMVGLTDLGEMAWQCEQVMNKWLKDEKGASAELLAFVDLAREGFERWVGELKATGHAAIDGTEITRRAEALKSEGEVPEPATPPAAAPAAQPEPASEQAPAMPSLELTTEPVAAPQAPVPAHEEQAGISFESLGLGEEAPSKPAAVEESAPAAAIPELDLGALTAPAESAAAGAQSAEEEEVAIGTVVLPLALFTIYVGEAEQHIATLNAEMAAIEADPMHAVSSAFMRAAHTLSSSSRTTGFDGVAEVAYALEKWLQDAIEFPPEFNEKRLRTTRRAVDALTAMVESLRGNALPYPRDDVAAELAELREELRAARSTGEGTHIRMPGMMREALAVPAPERSETAAPVAPEPSETAASAAQEPSEAAVPAAPEPSVAAAPGTSAPLETITPAAAEPEASPLTFDFAALVPPAAPIEQPPQAAPAHEAVLAPKEEAALPPAEAPTPASAEPPAVAEGPKPFEAGKDQRRIKDDVDRDLLPIFLDEAKEIVPLVSDGVRRWKAAPADHSPAPELARHLHTLKGSARMAGLMRLGELAHVLEERVNRIDEVESPPLAEFEEIEERVDRFSISLERLAKGEDIVEAAPVEVPVGAVFEHQKDKPPTLAVMAAAAQEVAQREALPPELREGRSALLRVNADMIDRFVNEAGELSIARSRIEGEVAAFKRALADLTENISRMRSQLREVEIAAETQMQSTIKAREESGEHFDPLEFDRFTRMQELTRFLAESLADVITLQQGLQKNLDEAELAINAQARLNRELQQGLMGVRLVPLANLGDRFYRIVRQTAKELDKKANLELKGTRTELDRSVLEKITAPFEHLLRNAIAHGIESSEQRVAAGKPEIGEIVIDAAQRGNEVVLTVSDDGAGLDFPRIRAKAIEAGLLAPDIELPEAQLAQFIFMPGFSTAKEVSQIAGRGVGMDVVKNEITSLGGRVEIASAPGRGTTFAITLPLTLAVTQAVMLRAGQSIYAVPSVMIEQVQEYKAEGYAQVAAAREIAWKDNRYPLRPLLPLLGEGDTPTPARQIPVLLLKSGTQRAAIRVDEIIGNREVVVKTIGPQLSRLAGIAGATVLGNGQVVLILNPVQLVHREGPTRVEVVHAAPVVPEPAPAKAATAPLVMVVDDSLTVRKITGRMLAREGYEVATAKDGVDALQQLQEMKPDCILLDVEMPRMDGFEFARNVRADEATRAIPIIMITSRTADKHRTRAMELGVNEYMGKPYQEDQLLALIRRYTASAVPA